MDDTSQSLPETKPASADEKGASGRRRPARPRPATKTSSKKVTAATNKKADKAEQQISSPAPEAEPAKASSDTKPKGRRSSPAAKSSPAISETEQPQASPEFQDLLASDEESVVAPAKKRRRRGGRGRKRPSADTSGTASAEVMNASQPDDAHTGESEIILPQEESASADLKSPGSGRSRRGANHRTGSARVEEGTVSSVENGPAAEPSARVDELPPGLAESGRKKNIPLTAETPILLLDASSSITAPVEVAVDVEPSRSGRSRRRGKKGQNGVKAQPMESGAASVSPVPTTAPGKSSRTDQKERRLLVSVLPDEQVEVVGLEGGVVREYYIEMTHQAKIRGNIYKGVISNIDNNLQAAFVNYGAVKNGFLQIDEVHPEYYLNHVTPAKGHKYPPIQKVLKPGQEVLVQVGKEPTGNKGAFLTTWVSLAGRFLVLTPGQEQIGISRKVEDGEERSRLRELIKGLNPGEGLGAIVRTVSAGVTKTTMQKDLSYLKRLWKDIRKRAMQEAAPSLIYQEPGLAERSVRDYLTDDVKEVWVDDEATAAKMRETVSLLFPRKAGLVHLYGETRKTLLEKFDALAQIEQIHSREVVLPSGGRLVFDQTEALMAIDINSGKSGGGNSKSNFETMAFRTNLEAAEAIPQQLRLRDIGGQIVIDFIEMRSQGQTREVEKTLRNAMKNDRARHDVSNMSPFGLLQIVRQRTGSSAISISMESCPFCQGTGTRRNMEWQAIQALRDLRRKMRDAHESGQTGLVYTVDPELALYLLNHKRERLGALEKELGMTLEIRPGRALA